MKKGNVQLSFSVPETYKGDLDFLRDLLNYLHPYFIREFTKSDVIRYCITAGLSRALQDMEASGRFNSDKFMHDHDVPIHYDLPERDNPAQALIDLLENDIFLQVK